MRASIRLGRIRGIPIGIHWSLLVIAGLLTVSLAEGRFPEAVPTAAPAAAWAAAILTAGLFFASVLAHELGHALVARRHGVGTRSITLWLLGGVAELEREAPDATAELRIAGAGPGTSAVLAVVFGGIGVSGAAFGAPEVLVLAFGWLAVINVVLALFNLIPAAPLDGGRVLTGVLWKRHGDRHRAVRTATSAGKIVGYGLIALGAVELLVLASFAGAWTALLGWFILSSAKAERLGDELRHDLEGALAEQAMVPQPPIVPDHLTVGDLPSWIDVRLPHRVVLLRGFDGHVRWVVPFDRIVAAARTPSSGGAYGPTLGGQARQLLELAVPIADVARVYADAPLTEALDAVGHSALPVVVVYDRADAVVGVIGVPELQRAATFSP